MGYIKSDLKPSKNWATLDYVLNGNLYHLPGWCLFTNHGSVGQSSIKRRLAQQWCVMSFHWSIHICAGWWFGTCFFFHILGISSSHLTNIFQRGRYTTNQVSILKSPWETEWKHSFDPNFAGPGAFIQFHPMDVDIPNFNGRLGYHLVNIQKTMENNHAIYG